MKYWFCILTVSATLAFAQDKRPVTLVEQSEATDRLKQLVQTTQATRNSSALNVELTVYLVAGLAQASPAAKDEVPSDLTPTLQQFKGVFAYKSYKLIEAVTLRGRNYGRAEVGGELPDYSYYNFKYGSVRISTETTPHVVHLDGLRLEITRRRGEKSETVALVSTDLDIREGQKTVVGKSAVNGTDALFLVIVPKVIE